MVGSKWADLVPALGNWILGLFILSVQKDIIIIYAIYEELINKLPN
jgi:hypothetical protein